MQFHSSSCNIAPGMSIHLYVAKRGQETVKISRKLQTKNNVKCDTD